MSLLAIKSKAFEFFHYLCNYINRYINRNSFLFKRRFSKNREK